MSEKYQAFKAFLANSKNNLKHISSGAFVPEKLTALLQNKGVVLVTQKQVRNIDFAVTKLQIASDSMASALAALNDFDDLDHAQLRASMLKVQEYQAVLTQIVDSAYKRRQDAVLGVAA